MTLRILLADDHVLVRAGVGALLTSDARVEVAGVAGDGLELLRVARRLAFDVAVVEPSMSGMNGIEATRRLLARTPDARVLCLAHSGDHHAVKEAFDAGARGYVLKRDPVEVLLAALRGVASGRMYLSSGLEAVFIEAYRNRDHVAAGPSPLTGREREVTQLYAEGWSTRQIAARLHISEKTVATHREHVFAKLGITGIAGLTRYALREGISRLDSAGAGDARDDGQARVSRSFGEQGGGTAG
ncbi:response regulator [Luteimonas abyssi]|uniref:response regulator n=1 Tax=Luteimonas abyssi TaxID=1247514 RepID=UPI000737C8FC|nr:response regulator transcription factor [Luteimonas abyssi]